MTMPSAIRIGGDPTTVLGFDSTFHCIDDEARLLLLLLLLLLTTSGTLQNVLGAIQLVSLMRGGNGFATVMLTWTGG
jgi:hypothetical protein